MSQDRIELFISTSKEARLAHVERGENQWFCFYCPPKERGDKFSSLDELDTHIKSSHREVWEKFMEKKLPRLHRCFYCNCKLNYNHNIF